MNLTNPKSFKCGSYKCMDLTFGNSECDKSIVFGGILIRAIMNVKSGKYIEGPCNSISEIISLLGANEFKELKIDS